MAKLRYTVIYLDPYSSRGWCQYCALKDTLPEAEKVIERARAYAAEDAERANWKYQVLEIVTEA